MSGSGLEEGLGVDAFALEVDGLTVPQIQARMRMEKENARHSTNELRRLQDEVADVKARIAENDEKIKVNKQLPYLVSTVVEVRGRARFLRPRARARPHFSNGKIPFFPSPLPPSPTPFPPTLTPSSSSAPPQIIDAPKDADEGGPVKKACVIKTTSRKTVFLPIPGLIDVDTIKPGDLVGVHNETHLIFEKLPVDYDARVKSMEVDEKPKDDYSDVGGCDKQIQELQEAIVLPLTHADRFKKLGVKPPKGVLLYGPPGTGKTLLARACAKETDAVFLKLAGTSLVQMYIGDGAKMVRDAFELAKEKSAGRGGACAAARRAPGRPGSPPLAPPPPSARAPGHTRTLPPPQPQHRHTPTHAPTPFRPRRGHHFHRRNRRRGHQAGRRRRRRQPRGAPHHAGAAQPAGRLFQQRPHQGDRRHEPPRDAGPRAPALRAAGPQDRAAAPGRKLARAHPADPLAQNGVRPRGREL